MAMTLDCIKTTTRYPSQWHLHEAGKADGVRIGINAIGAWHALAKKSGKERAFGNPQIKVVVLDTGIDPDHPDLSPNIDWAGAASFDQTYMDFSDYEEEEKNGGHHVDRANYKAEDLEKLKKEKGRMLLNKHDAHGTACAGIVAAAGVGSTAKGGKQDEKENGCVGVAPGCRIVPVRISTNFEVGSLIKAVEHAAGAGQVLLLPRTMPRVEQADIDRTTDPKRREELERRKDETDRLEAAILAAALKVPVICASGNNGTGRLGYPASVPGTIAVGACNEKGYRSTYSQYGHSPEGNRLHVVAPSNDAQLLNRTLVRLRKREEHDETDPLLGDPADLARAAGRVPHHDRLGRRFIETTDNTGRFGYNVEPRGNYCLAEGNYGFGGTSAAAAQVAGVVALMLSANPDLTVQDVRDILREAATLDDPLLHKEIDTGIERKDGEEWCAEFGFGLVDAARAVAKAIGRVGAAAAEAGKHDDAEAERGVPMRA